MNRAFSDRRLLIVLVDPDLAGSRSLQAALANRFQFLIESNSEAALRTANGAAVWLWVIAGRLPDLNGAEFCHLLRSRDPTAQIVVIGAAGENEIACRMAGASHFFCWPLDARLFTLFVEGLARGDQKSPRKSHASARGRAGPRRRRGQSLPDGQLFFVEGL